MISRGGQSLKFLGLVLEMTQALGEAGDDEAGKGSGLRAKKSSESQIVSVIRSRSVISAATRLPGHHPAGPAGLAGSGAKPGCIRKGHKTHDCLWVCVIDKNTLGVPEQHALQGDH